MKTEIYNLIILDESGSMSPVITQTINGCNETINTIISSQQQFSETQDHYISIFAFQSNSLQPSRYLIKNVPALEVNHINAELYRPWGGTPLYDAIGATLVDLKALVKNREAIGSVTIITDGEENSSTMYSREKVACMIEELKSLGWNFNFIGANIDAKSYATSLNIDNSLQFQQSEEGTRQMFAKERECRMSYNSRIHECMSSPDIADDDSEGIRSHLCELAKGYFKKGEA